jgi:uncharacterized protein YutE (UPF0331/DUF86 family)
MTFLVERLAELGRYLVHGQMLAGRMRDEAALEHDLTVRNDVVHTLFLIAQLVIDIAGELASRHGARVENYKQAIRGLANVPEFPNELVAQLEPLAGFRNIVVHEYISLDLQQVIAALRQLERVQQFLSFVSAHEAR